MTEQQSYQESGWSYRSLFWPVILIGIGVIWLLGNIGILSGQQILAGLRLWPLLLIAAGLDLLIGRRSPAVGVAIGVMTIVVFVGAMLFGPALGLFPEVELQETTLTEPLEEEMRAYSVRIRSGVEQVNVEALDADAENLLEADVLHYGELDYNVSGTTEKTIDIGHAEGQSVFSINIPFLNVQPEQPRWDIALNPALPLSLTVNGGVGELNIDLAQMNLEDAQFNLGVGETNLTLPEPQQSYTVSIDGGVGETSVDLPEGLAVRLMADIGVGDIEVDYPGLAPSGDADVWETADYDDAEVTVTIRFDGGVGDFTIR